MFDAKSEGQYGFESFLPQRPEALSKTGILSALRFTVALSKTKQSMLISNFICPYCTLNVQTLKVGPVIHRRLHEAQGIARRCAH